MPNRRGRDGEWGNGAIVAVIGAMVIVMALIAFTLHRNSPLVACWSHCEHIGTSTTDERIP
jgi:hypothetical protein